MYIFSSSKLSSSFPSLWGANVSRAEPLLTLNCAPLSVALDYNYRSGRIVSDLRHEHSLLSMRKSWPFCQPLSPSPDTCVPRLGQSAGSFLTRWARQPRGTEANGRCNKVRWIGWRESRGSLTFSEVWKKGFRVTTDWQDSATFYFRNTLVRLQ